MEELSDLEITLPEVNRTIRKYMSALGKRGGPATLKKYGREHFVNMRKLSSGRSVKVDILGSSKDLTPTENNS